MKIYDAAIIGLGPSGLAVNKLIYDNQNKEIIAFDDNKIDKRDNFFGFWLTDWMKPYDNLIEKKWKSWQISNKHNSISHSDANRPYCVISYKKWKDFCLNTNNNFNFVNKKVINYELIKDYFKIILEDGRIYFAKKIYDSRSEKEQNNETIQHFFGLNIVTEDNTFNENKLTLMHFTEDSNHLHFIYVLPFSHKKALVESTVFSKKSMNEKWYRDQINKYLQSLSISKFKEISSETGVIPMFFVDQKKPIYSNVFNIGIRGGACKPSTGYAFSFLIKHIQLLKKGNRNDLKVHKYVEKLMDRIFLNYLKNNNERGKIFIDIAESLSGSEFQSFMMGQSSILTKLKIIKSMPKLPFIKALISL